MFSKGPCVRGLALTTVLLGDDRPLGGEGLAGELLVMGACP
jgi:hypothetical protein